MLRALSLTLAFFALAPGAHARSADNGARQSQSPASLSEQASLVRSTTSTDSWEIRTAPIMFMAAWSTVDVSYRLNTQWSTGPAAVFYQNSGRGGMLFPAMSGSALGWQALGALKSLDRSSLCMTVHAYYQNFSSSGEAQGDSRDQVKGYSANVDFGYRMKRHHFTMVSGIGAQYTSAESTRVYDQPSTPNESPKQNSSVIPHLEFKIGITF